MISSAVVSRSTDKLMQCLLLISTGAAPEVVARIMSTLERKWLVKSSAVCEEVADVCGIFNRVLIFDQRALKSPMLDLMALDQ
jgi:hypothetical protein